MGSKVSLGSIGSRGQELVEIVAIGPEDVPALLRPLLGLGLHDLCELYHRFAGSDGDKVSIKELEPRLRLDPRGIKLLSAGKQSVPLFDLLVVLAVASRTHALTKARFIFCLCDRSGEGCLDFESFLSAASALLSAGASLGSGKRSPAAVKKSLVEQVAWTLFKPHDPSVAKDTFVKIASSQGGVWQLLRRFARDASPKHFVLEPWEKLASIRSLEAKANEDPAPIRAPTSMSYAAKSSIAWQNPLDNIENTLKRKGYYLAVPSTKEAALKAQLAQVHESMRNGSSGTGDGDLGTSGTAMAELEIQEEKLRNELFAEVMEDDGRMEYRLQLQKLRSCGSRPASARAGGAVVPRGRLWTVSRAHAANGGELPPGAVHALSPEEIKQAALQAASKSTPPSRLEERKQMDTWHVASPRRSTPPDLLHAPPATSRSGLAESMTGGSDDNASTLVPNRSTSGTACAPRSAMAMRRGDVLLAFELYRSDYWRKEGGGVLSLREARMSLYPPEVQLPAEIEKRRNLEIDLIMKEVEAEQNSKAPPSADGTKEMTLTVFLTTLWPFASRGDLACMMRWIKQSRVQDPRGKRRREQAVKPNPATLRELIDLFDAIDTARTGHVPIEAVEKFLCGEIITETETVKLQQREKLSGNFRSIAEYEHFVDHVRYPYAARFNRRTVEDRPDWQVGLPPSELDHEDGTGSPRKAAFRGLEQKEYQSRLCNAVERNMESLANFLNEEFTALVPNAEDVDMNMISSCIEAASQPQLRKPSQKGAAWPQGSDEGAGKRLRLARLYWRYLLGCAINQQLRPQRPTRPGHEQHRLELKNGQLDLLGFMYVLAQDQINAIFTPGKPAPTATLLRRLAAHYAFE
eukprot:gb/GFBE01016850.1/.p1 GENE.gb/GFBE01016850.1/~~gb/GFBE01016850.1/.p1  ORF type:complete len:862 (+),score=184.74 gb/GFBE01016850.1/:1-2586(+)